jgi:hypothetical protein
VPLFAGLLTGVDVCAAGDLNCVVVVVSPRFVTVLTVFPDASLNSVDVFVCAGTVGFACAGSAAAFGGAGLAAGLAAAFGTGFGGVTALGAGAGVAAFGASATAGFAAACGFGFSKGSVGAGGFDPAETFVAGSPSRHNSYKSAEP